MINFEDAGGMFGMSGDMMGSFASIFVFFTDDLSYLMRFPWISQS